jgi:glycosyltransferase involved in cell wall biosynthesis
VAATTIILPVQNAESSIKSTLEHLLDVLEDQGDTFQILIEDRDSSDGTIDVVLELASRNPQVKVRSCGYPGTKSRKSSTRLAMSQLEANPFENLDFSEIEFERKKEFQRKVPNMASSGKGHVSKGTPIDLDDSSLILEWLTDPVISSKSNQPIKTDALTELKSESGLAERADMAHTTRVPDRHPVSIEMAEPAGYIASYHVG